MKVRDTDYKFYLNRAPPTSQDIFDAVQAVLHHTYADGYIEQAHEVASNCAEMIGKLVQALHDNGRITDEQVLVLLPDHERDPLT